VVFAVAIGSLALASAVQASGLPRVYIGYPNPAPCDQSIKVKGKYVDHRVACYQVRPSAISASEDGDGFLSGITWSVWNGDSAKGSALESVRCFGVPKGQAEDPNCAPYHCGNSAGTAYCEPGVFSYNVPATIRLTVPVSTSSGIDFTRVRVSSSHSETVCLPPANSC
jgi:hypothetical protein